MEMLHEWFENFKQFVTSGTGQAIAWVCTVLGVGFISVITGIWKIIFFPKTPKIDEQKPDSSYYDKILILICFLCAIIGVVVIAVIKKNDNQNRYHVLPNYNASEEESNSVEDNYNVPEEESNSVEDNYNTPEEESNFVGDNAIPIIQMPASPIECCDMKESITDLYGNAYHDNILMMDASRNAFVTYDLDGSYSNFAGYLVCSTETGNDVSINVGIFADGQLLEKVTDFSKANRAKEININISNAKTLSIKTSNDGEYGYGFVYFVNSFFRKGNHTKVNQYNRLKDLFVIDSSSYDPRTVLFNDSYGNLYDGCEMFDASMNAMAIYNLDQSFSSFSASIVCLPQTGSGADMTLEIYVDDKIVFSKSGIKKQHNKIDFNVSVKGGSTLKILTSNQGEFSYGHLAIVNDYLVP